MIARRLRTIRPTISTCKDTQNPRHLQAPAKTFFLPAKNAYPDGELFLIQRRIKRIERIILARVNYKRITRIFAAAGQLRTNYSNSCCRRSIIGELLEFSLPQVKYGQRVL
jgi:hypothetical protein